MDARGDQRGIWRILRGVGDIRWCSETEVNMYQVEATARISRLKFCP